MVMSNHLRGVEVWIGRRGGRFTEYEDRTVAEDERNTTRYIEAKTGQEFAVHMRVGREAVFAGECISFAVYVDGNFIENLVLGDKPNATFIEGPPVGRGMIRKFQFAKILTASDWITRDSEAVKVKELGTIVVNVSHVNWGVRTTSWTPTTESIGMLSEKALKGQAVSHSVGFGGAKTVPETVSWTTPPVHGVPDPAAVFRFHYRSIEALKSMLIIPRTPPPRSLDDRDITSMSREELLDFQRQFQVLKEAQSTTVNIKSEPVKIKRERGDNNPRPRKTARPNARRIQVELDDDGNVREGSTTTLVAKEIEVIELD